MIFHNTLYKCITQRRENKQRGRKNADAWDTRFVPFCPAMKLSSPTKETLALFRNAGQYWQEILCLSLFLFFPSPLSLSFAEMPPVSAKRNSDITTFHDSFRGGGKLVDTAPYRILRFVVCSLNETCIIRF